MFQELAKIEREMASGSLVPVVYLQRYIQNWRNTLDRG